MKRRALILVGALASVVSGCGTAEGEAEEAPSLVTVPVETGNLLISAEATGNVEPIRDVEVKSKASGEILRLHVDVGDVVEPGTLLAEIDPRDVRNGFEQAEADLEVAKARMEISEAQLARNQELLDAGVITQQDYESRKLDHANAVAQMVRSETNHELAALRLEDVRIRAPMAGTVIQRNVDEGTVIQSASQNVSGGTTLVVMANLNEMQVRTLVDETDMGDIRAGMSTTVKVEAFPERRFVGTVEKVEPQAVVQQNVTMFPVIIRLDNENGLLKPGMNAEVTIEINEARNVMLLPNNAVVQVQDAGAAMMVLGLDPEGFDLRSMMRGGAGGGPGGAERDAAEEGSTDGEGDARTRLAELRRKAEAGEITQDSMRTAARALMQNAQAGGERGGFGGGDSNSAVVFVVTEDGSIEPRVVRTGLSDWDNTQVISGVQEGEQIAVVGAAALQAASQQFLNRFRGGGSPFGRR